MKVRCTVAEASMAWAYVPGVIYDVTEVEAARLIAQKKAVEVIAKRCPHCGETLAEDDPPETATLAQNGERAVLAGGRRRSA